MGNAFVNAFAVLEPSTGKDGFSRRQAPRKPSESRTGVNRLFRSNLASLPSLENNQEPETSEDKVTFVVESFLKRPTMA